ncbi:MAG: UDP-N-acetylmuramoyl-L-alanyl-D-glutamate--2,6-diaminopimelate ligase [Flavobacteriales bacterium]|nr:UDP-N-acetylmuramoyl-L-alanyl-D-glutamate--2,6-diaminopimelate ligase [Flavobacteriales bacterium]MBP9079412.1 UDP-N-acetylmuramoyl-L-alanyl-D-glutamate--2,6-diaminopimelate ligase [Flavobacteriales bacterium]
MKALKDILYRTRLEQVVGDTLTAIDRITFDSREAGPNCAFVAVRGAQADGHRYITTAVGQGAAAIICEDLPGQFKAGVTYVRVADSRHALAVMAGNLYEHPDRKLKLTGITGTNGKTSVATLLHKLFGALGHKSALISTVEIRIGDQVVPATHTTPDPVRLNALFDDMVAQGVTHCFMEVSSHAVVQQRIAGLHFALGVFTNITHDHLDYHGTFDAYIQAKKGFFDALPAAASALVNADDVHGAVMVQNTKAAKCSYAVRNMADHRARIIENQLTGLQLNIDGRDMYSRLVGEFNASNLLAVYSAAVLLGQQPIEVLTALSDLEPPPGRFQVVRGHGGVIGIVDYAHTPDALKNVLGTIGAVCGDSGRVITVVGCGGDRDRAKRPVMAAIAASLSRCVVLTNDNPRSEEPMDIIGEMRKGLLAADLARVFVNTDRREAIRQAVGLAAPGDVVLVAGKGHEDYQEVRGVRHHFNDVEVLKETLELLRK